MVGFARESPQWSTAISDAILALSAFVGAEYLWQQRQRCSGDKGVYISSIIALVFMGWPALLGAFRFVIVNWMWLRRAHRLFADFGACVGLPLLGVSVFFAAPAAQPTQIRTIIKGVAIGLVIVFLIVRSRIFKVDPEAYVVSIGLIGLVGMLLRGASHLSHGLYLCATSPWTREARKHFTKDEALQNSTNLLHCVVDSTSGVLCMLCAILIMVAGLAIGTKGMIDFGGDGKRKAPVISIPRVDIFHYFLAMSNFCITVAIMGFSFTDQMNLAELKGMSWLHNSMTNL